jgi:hypothetical protein
VNKYFGTASHKSSKKQYEKNKTLALVRMSILQNKSMCLGTSSPEKWHTILRTEFPNVALRIDGDCLIINERAK